MSSWYACCYSTNISHISSSLGEMHVLDCSYFGQDVNIDPDLISLMRLG